MPEPGIEDIVANELNAVRNAMMAVENGCSQDDHEDGWYEAHSAAGALVDAAENLKDCIFGEIREREDEWEDEDDE